MSRSYYSFQTDTSVSIRHSFNRPRTFVRLPQETVLRILPIDTAVSYASLIAGNLTFDPALPLSPLVATHTRNAPVSPLLATLTKKLWSGRLAISPDTRSQRKALLTLRPLPHPICRHFREHFRASLPTTHPQPPRALGLLLLPLSRFGARQRTQTRNPCRLQCLPRCHRVSHGYRPPGRPLPLF